MGFVISSGILGFTARLLFACVEGIGVFLDRLSDKMRGSTGPRTGQGTRGPVGQRERSETMRGKVLICRLHFFRQFRLVEVHLAPNLPQDQFKGNLSSVQTLASHSVIMDETNRCGAL